MMGRDDARPGAASLVLVDGVPLLHPEVQVFEAMLEGWRNQGAARNLAGSTLTTREGQVRRFADHANAFPWQWSPQLADEWFADFVRSGTVPGRRCAATRSRSAGSAGS